MQNALIVGSRKEAILDYLPDTYLILDDGELIDRIEIPENRAVTEFDVSIHSFDVLKDMSYRKACDFVDVLKGVFPEGDGTLTKAAFEYQVFEALAAKPKSLDVLIKDTKDTRYAYQKIQRVLYSPVLKNVLLRPGNLSFRARRQGKKDAPAIIHARLNRGELGDFDCYVLGNLLISQYPGPVVIPDFGFYHAPFHSALLRQNRLVAGIHSFDEVPRFKHQLLTVEEKIASRCTPKDAEILAIYKGYIPQTVDHTGFVQEAIA